MTIEVKRIITDEIVEPAGDGYYGVWPKASLVLDDRAEAIYDYASTYKHGVDDDAIARTVNTRSKGGLNGFPEAWDIEYGVAYETENYGWRKIVDDNILGVWFLRGFNIARSTQNE